MHHKRRALKLVKQVGDKNLSGLDNDSVVLQQGVVSVLNVFQVHAPTTVLNQNRSIAS